MKITITYNVNHCYECPYKYLYQDMGASGYICGKLKNLSDIPRTGFRPDCPLQKNNAKERK